MTNLRQTTACTCLGGSTHGTDDPAIRLCDLCGGVVPSDPSTGEYKAAQTTGWQPIETAPRDGTRILASDGQSVEVIFNAHGDGWFNQSSEISMWRVFPPTHWMPLPEPPTP